MLLRLGFQSHNIQQGILLKGVTVSRRFVATVDGLQASAVSVVSS